ncbi:hypothetical protein B296_00019811 [Ensete ventricosum]|uniref:Uncharacterized protein n=1 Tax=Ensete ventricosum TaxID=4639 RepID=A0A426ZGB5_ENSVE|nr:hypothetical protein B296_00019811 [Ensete ventricosum]
MERNIQSLDQRLQQRRGETRSKRVGISSRLPLGSRKRDCYGSNSKKMKPLVSLKSTMAPKLRLPSDSTAGREGVEDANERQRPTAQPTGRVLRLKSRPEKRPPPDETYIRR